MYSRASESVVRASPTESSTPSSNSGTAPVSLPLSWTNRLCLDFCFFHIVSEKIPKFATCLISPVNTVHVLTYCVASHIRAL